jgi:hypothetical protein
MNVLIHQRGQHLARERTPIASLAWINHWRLSLSIFVPSGRRSSSGFCTTNSASAEGTSRVRHAVSAGRLRKACSE